MAEQNPEQNKPVKSPHAEREERVLSYWKEKNIFEKTLKKASPKGEFVFYEGPPTANGRPGIHHLEARAFKDAIPRYKTMRGYHVARKGGWDTHGLPVELQVEKELGLKSKKEIEIYGIAAFNEKCKESVWKYVHEWEDFTDRIGYWVDLKDPYITYKPDYIESLWYIVKKVDEQGLLYKDYKVLPWCPRCGTALSSHELAQGYEDVKDLSVTAKFRLKPGQKFGTYETQNSAYILAWTTTPWTLPGNAALAVNKSIMYKAVRINGIPELLILAEVLTEKVLKDHSVEIVHADIKGSDLVGLEYEPLYPFLKNNVTGTEKDKLANAFKVYAADFVTTEDGTGIVHIAPMYGQDDFELGTKQNLPKYHLVNEDGTFKKEAGFLAGKFVKDEEVAVEIIKDLAHRGLLFHKEKHEHSYPFCWRCHTPLIYFARDSWYIKMSALRHKLVKENEGINWEPEHIKEGRFGEWLREVKDWAISRERYWGTPLPIWSCQKCGKKKIVGSVAEVEREPNNTYHVMRHGEAVNNVDGVLSGDPKTPHHLTQHGKEQVEKTAASLKSKGTHFDLVFVSPFVRTQETVAILKEKLGLKDDQIITDDRIRELGSGSWNGRKVSEYVKHFHHIDRFDSKLDGVENYAEIKKRTGDFLYDIDAKYQGKKILIVTHETPAHLLMAAAGGFDRRKTLLMRSIEDADGEFMKNAEVRKLDFKVLPHNPEYELDLHRPYIDEIKLKCGCGGEMNRAKEVMDVWFDSGAMPFAQHHYPFAFKEESFFSRLFFKNVLPYPADFISEGLDQTRGWFYTLHAIGTLLGRGKAFKNVVIGGTLLDAQGKKMSKSLGNTVDPLKMIEKYGGDALRFWMYSINQAGDPKSFDEKTVDEVVKKVFNLATNVLSFYKMYAGDKGAGYRVKGVDKSQTTQTAPYILDPRPSNVLDQWIISRLNEMVAVAMEGLDTYKFLEPTRAIRDFIADLSQWYLRRSRDRFKGDNENDKQAALATTTHVLITLAKVMAPFTPFFAEYLYEEAGGPLESVHLEEWPEAGSVDKNLIVSMNVVRDLASKGLEARMAAKINVRQPLAKLKVQPAKLGNLDARLAQLIKDEVNVREIAVDASIQKDVELDTSITPELKEEGELRELVREVQDLRKAMGLSVGDTATLILPGDKKDLASKYEASLKKSASLSGIEFGDKLELKK